MRYNISSMLMPMLGAVALALAPQSASAESGKAALVIGNGIYESGSPLPVCDQSARNVTDWLQRQGFDVEQVLDASSVAMRSAIGNFVTRLSGSPQATAIVYVCTYAAVANQRLFMLPVESDPTQPAHLETHGVVVKALLNTLAGTNGVLFADLDMPADQNAADAIDLLQSGLPAGVHFAVVARKDQRIGTLGRNLPTLLANSGQDWGKLSAAFQTQYGPSGADRLAVFAPLTGPMPPPAAGPAGHGEDQAKTVAPSVATNAAPSPGRAASDAAPPPASTQSASTQPASTQPASAQPTSAQPAASDAQTSHPPVAASTASTTVARPRPAPSVASAAPAVHPVTRPTDLRTGRIQAALARLGFYAGPVNGRMDNNTRDAIRTFQTTLDDAPSGVLTPIQIVKLLNTGR